MSKTTVYQRQQRTGQPYTRIAADKKYNEVEVPQEDGSVLKGLQVEDCFMVFGYTLEDKLQPEVKGEDPEWKKEWEEHELGQAADLEEVHAKAADWVESLRGVYAIR